MSTWRALGILLAGIVIGIVVLAAGGYTYAGTANGQGLLRDFMVAQAQQAAQQPPQGSSNQSALSATSTAIAVAATSSPIVLIPKTYASQDYFLALNEIVSDITAINQNNVALGPVLEQLNALSLSCSYQNFYDLMTQARALADKNQVLTAQFGQHLIALNAANMATADAVLKSDTFALITPGQAFGQQMQTYASAVQSLLYGGTPTSAQLTTFQNTVAQTADASQAFAAVLTPLLNYIVTVDQQLSNTSTGAQ